MNKSKVQKLIDENIEKILNDFLENLNKELSDFHNGEKTYNQLREALGLPIINDSNANKLITLSDHKKAETIEISVQPPRKPIRIKVRNTQVLGLELKKLEEMKIIEEGNYRNLEIEIE